MNWTIDHGPDQHEWRGPACLLILLGCLAFWVGVVWWVWTNWRILS